jgi:hypothetical protein
MMRGRWGASWSPARAAMLEKPNAAPKHTGKNTISRFKTGTMKKALP